MIILHSNNNRSATQASTHAFPETPQKHFAPSTQPLALLLILASLPDLEARKNKTGWGTLRYTYKWLLRVSAHPRPLVREFQAPMSAYSGENGKLTPLNQVDCYHAQPSLTCRPD